MNWKLRRFLQAIVQLSLVICLTAVVARAQSPLVLPDWLSLEERARIEKEKDDKNRTEVLLKVSTARLGVARNNLGAQQYEQASDEIRNFGNLISYTASFINNLPKKENDKKKLFKLLEVNLRGNLNNLESLRFELPEKYAVNAQEVYEQMKKVREVALGAVFGNDFFPAASTDEGKSVETPNTPNNEK